jgi:hypothetical protein
MSYDSDIPVSQNYVGAGDGVQYARPPPDSDYLRNRIARLTFDLKTGGAQVEK